MFDFYFVLSIIFPQHFQPKGDLSFIILFFSSVKYFFSIEVFYASFNHLFRDRILGNFSYSMFGVLSR